MHHENDRPQPISVYDAAPLFGGATSTIHGWALRYHVTRVGELDGKVYFDRRDLAVIERELRHGHPVPGTPEERAAVAHHCPLRDVEHRTAA